MPSPPPAPSCSGVTVRDLLDGADLRSVYQPIVDLVTGEVVAYEALMRGPQDHPLESPDALFAAADAEGLRDELDWQGVRSAVIGALDAGLDTSTTLFVNIEGGSVGHDLTGADDLVLRQAQHELRLVMEVTERDLLARPRHLMTLAETLRDRGWGLAIDDVGVDHPEGLAAMAMVQPEVVKLDMALVRDRTDPGAMAVALAVQAYAEEVGAAIVAEGIEDAEDLQRALVLGATLGQGWHFGRPGPLPTAPTRPSRAVPMHRRAVRRAGSTTPYELAYDHLTMRTARKRTLIPVSRQLEAMALRHAPAVALLGVFQEHQHFTIRSRMNYARMSTECALVAALAAGMAPSPIGRVHGGALAPDDELLHEWTVIVLAPHYSAALVGKDLGDPRDVDLDRRFEYAVTHDRTLVAAMASTLMARLDHRAGLRTADHGWIARA